MDIQYYTSMCQHIINNKLLRKPIRLHSKYKNYVDKKDGIELGGPSKVFTRTGQFPVYEFATSVDNCNFSEETVWAKHDHQYFIHDNIKLGKQYISEASDFNNLISCKKYDFLLASHILEHIANPIKALLNWCSLVTDDGLMIIVLPNSRYTFDRKREPTDYNHLLKDCRENIGEHDLFHMEEIVENHDYSLDAVSLNRDYFRERALSNYLNRCLHHHIFNDNNLYELFTHCNLKIVDSVNVFPYHMFYFLHKVKHA